MLWVSVGRHIVGLSVFLKVGDFKLFGKAVTVSWPMGDKRTGFF